MRGRKPVGTVIRMWNGFILRLEVTGGKTITTSSGERNIPRKARWQIYTDAKNAEGNYTFAERINLGFGFEKMGTAKAASIRAYYAQSEAEEKKEEENKILEKALEILRDRGVNITLEDLKTGEPIVLQLYERPKRKFDLEGEEI